MSKKNIVCSSAVLIGAIMLTTSCTTSNTLKPSGSTNVTQAEVIPMQPVDTVVYEDFTVEETPVPESTPAPVPDETITYTIKKGDMLGKIAKRYNVSVADICELNNIADKNKIYAGQEILIPAFGQVAATASSSSYASQTTDGGTYVVQRGDALSKIASKFGVKTSAIASANNISNPNSIYVGQKLIIPGVSSTQITKKKSSVKKTTSVKPAPVVTQAPEMNLDEAVMVIDEPVAPSVATEAPSITAPVVEEEVMEEETNLKPNIHIASEVEDLHSVAQMWGCTVEEIATFNNIPVDTILKKGDKVKIPNVLE